MKYICYIFTYEIIKKQYKKVNIYFFFTDSFLGKERIVRDSG